MRKRNPIDEACRYVHDARETLEIRGNLDTEKFEYQDDKYVRTAGNYLWLGVLMALDAVFHVRENRCATMVN